MNDTIFALSSGAPPAAIGIIRISGPKAGAVLTSLSAELPPARSAKVRSLRDRDGGTLDEAVVLWFPGPATATGEDLVELHCHGGRAVIAAVLDEIGKFEGLREAQPGEFTRRAFTNGRIDLAEAEGLADLLAAETEFQRRGAIVSAGGAFSRQIEEWRNRVLDFAAIVEAAIDFSEEDGTDALPPDLGSDISSLAVEIASAIDRPETERLRDGIRVVLAGPPNAGKSSLFNALLRDDAAIVTAEAGTTRDVLERPISIGGVPFVLVDTAGLRLEGAGAIEVLGIERTRRELSTGQIILWLGSPGEKPPGSVSVGSKSDIEPARDADIKVSAVTGEGIAELLELLVDMGRKLLPPVDTIAFNRRQKALATDAVDFLHRVDLASDLLLAAENLRCVRRSFDMLIGRDSTEEMLDALFGRFCLGK